ncbi:MAG: hypothetical protein LBD70_01505 [Bifidobacteriaceae bacterium]|nr:hypothetical protein [Bifidobacteriaceae bacterium]
MPDTLHAAGRLGAGDLRIRLYIPALAGCSAQTADDDVAVLGAAPGGPPRACAVPPSRLA